MTLSTTTNKVSYTGTGLVSTYAYSFRVLDSSDLVVIKADTDGVETTLTLNTDYTVTGAGSYNGGNVVLTTALEDDYTLLIKRVVTVDQETDIRNQTAFYAEVHEEVFDKLTMIDQQQQEQLSRAAVLPESMEGVGAVPTPVDGTILGWVAGKWAWLAAATAQLAANLLDSTSVALGDALMIVKQPFTGAIAITQHFFNKDWVSVTQFGAVGDGVTDDWAAIMAAIDSGVGRIYFPPGTYYISKCLNIRSIVMLYGADGTLSQEHKSILKFADGITGIILHRAITDADDTGHTPVIVASSGGAYGTILKNLTIQRGDGTIPALDSISHGVWVKVRCKIVDCIVKGFAGNGIHIVAQAGSSDPMLSGNANKTRISDSYCYANAGNGLYLDGADANSGMIDNLDCAANGGWGIYDSSFLGNTYVACNVSLNVGGSIKTDNANARSLFLGCYIEGDAGATPSLISPSMVIGGFAAEQTYLTPTAGLTLRPTGSNYVDNGANYFTSLYSGTSKSQIRLVPSASIIESWWNEYASSDSANSWRLTWMNDVGDIALGWTSSSTSRVYELWSDLTTYTAGRASGVAGHSMYIPALLVGATRTVARRITNATAAPTSGEWAKGDVIWNSSVAAAGSPGWLCTTAGTGGSTAVFKTMAVVAA